ncbi:MAG TPA: hypothetical protein VL337_02090, partial [Acidimicrobiales bacterium]|nr:hypothetical protein [Acidimicrobiales bacterium]
APVATDPSGGHPRAPGTEKSRLASDPRAWKRWGPYVAERAWGTVREDYSPDGDVWGWFPHDEARSRVYRWNEDGLAAVCDDAQTLCFGFAFWNGRDPILKERIFGLSGEEGNHGEDAKEYWWYLDSTPTHSFMRWRWLYPQAEFPYAALVEESQRRTRSEPEYELVDTGVLDGDRYWDITADYAKAGPDDLCVRLSVRNAGPDEATIDVLPTLWFRNTWSWGLDDRRPVLTGKDGRVVAEHHGLGRMTLTGDGQPELLFCENESNAERLWGVPGSTPYPKDGIARHVLHGEPSVNPDATGTKAALRYRLSVPAGQTAEIVLRLSTAGDDPAAAADILAARAKEADAFYAALTPAGVSPDEAAVMRQAFAGMLWSKQFFHYDVERWLDGDPAGPTPPESRRHVRNADWRHLNNADVISMPDKWEYPWFAAWDLAFHCVALAHVDPDFAKDQLLLMCREWYMHPNGQLPAYEWNFSDVNPPVHAWAALRVFEISGGTDFHFLERILHKLLLNFTWWVNRKDAAGNNVFEGGFLGLDNIGPIDRSAQLPVDGRLEQSDGTSWMAMYCLNLLEIALVLTDHDPSYEDMATKFFEHFTYIATAINDRGLWNEEDGFYYDVLALTTGERVPLRVRSMVGLLPLCATTTLGQATLDRLPYFAGHFRWFERNKPQFVDNVVHAHRLGAHEGRLLSIVGPERLERILATMLDTEEFLSPHGLRAVAASHREHPFETTIGGMVCSVDYEPGESTSGLFGGNSNWRGPIWFPVNYLVVEALRRFGRYFGDDVTVEHPAGSGHRLTLDQVADELSQRLIAIFLDDDSGRRPVFGDIERFQSDPALHGMIPFHEYFHGDTGKGIGASHQTGWTGLVADLIARKGSK